MKWARWFWIVLVAGGSGISPVQGQSLGHVVIEVRPSGCEEQRSPDLAFRVLATFQHPVGRQEVFFPLSGDSIRGLVAHDGQGNKASVRLLTRPLPQVAFAFPETETRDVVLEWCQPEALVGSMQGNFLALKWLDHIPAPRREVDVVVRFPEGFKVADVFLQGTPERLQRRMGTEGEEFSLRGSTLPIGAYGAVVIGFRPGLVEFLGSYRLNYKEIFLYFFLPLAGFVAVFSVLWRTLLRTRRKRREGVSAAYENLLLERLKKEAEELKKREEK